MKKNSNFGASTKTGSLFENLQLRIPLGHENFVINGRTLLFFDKTIGYFGKNNSIYKLENIFKNSVFNSVKYRPDEYCVVGKQLFIFEKKYQQVAGSVDEKLLTAPYKQDYYADVFSTYDTQYCLILSKWFQQPKYKSWLPWLKHNGCIISFEELPVEMFEKLAATIGNIVG